MKRKRGIFSSAGFSLVEVTLAIGIVSFALLAVVALLPVGLKSVKNSAEQAAGAAVLESLSEALRNAATTNGTDYEVNFSGTTKTFAAGGNSTHVWDWPNITLEGFEMPGSAANRRIVGRLEILQTPSADGLRPGRAVASVAWSAMANPAYNTNTRTWDKAEGSLSAPLQFFPGRP